MNIGSVSPQTSFSLDLMGRYVCNTFEEALAISDPGFRATATDVNGQALSQRGDLRPFDFIVIGGGTFGGAVAEQLWFRSASRSERILVLEAGPFLLAEHQQNLPSFAPGGEVWGRAWNADPSLNFPGLAYCIGGRSIFWGGWSPRPLSPQETAMWPAAVVADLDTATLPSGDDGYYRQSSRQIGVTVENDFIFGALHRALRQRLFDSIGAGSIAGAFDLATLPDAPPVEIIATPTIQDLARMLDVELPTPLPTGAALAALATELRNKLKLEAPLAVRSSSEHAGYFPLNKFSTVPLLIKAARAAYAESPGDDVKKRVMIVPRTHVTRLRTVDEVGGKRVVAIETEHGDVMVSPDTRVIIALGTIESTRLALLSFSGNPNIGANLMAHLRSNVDLRIPRAALAGLLPLTITALQSSALFLKGQARYSDGTFGTFHLQITASGLGKTGSGSESELFQKIPDVDTLDQHLKASDTHVVITIRGIGEMEPNNPRNNVTLDQNPAATDYGQRRAYVNLSPSARDLELWDAMDAASDDVARAFAGAASFEVFSAQQKAFVSVPSGADLRPVLPYAPNDLADVTKRGRRDNLGTTHHEAGTLRFGTTPATSVTNVDCRFHEVTNSYVASPALIPRLGSPNPMLTGIALARRLGDHLLPAPPVRVLEPGFRALFNGSQPSGAFFQDWLLAGGGSFTIVGRTLVARPGNGIGLLYYAREQFDDFTLRLDFWLSHPRGNMNDNSGVFVRFRDPRKPPLPGSPPPDVPGNPATIAVDTGYEIQIDEEARGDTRRSEPDGFFYQRTGAVYKVKSRGTGPGQQDYRDHAPLAIGVWHDYSIQVTGRRYEVLIDGASSTTFNADPADPVEKFRGRKKSEDPDSGFIGLQVHTGTVAFGNIRISP